MHHEFLTLNRNLAMFRRFQAYLEPDVSYTRHRACDTPFQEGYVGRSSETEPTVGKPKSSKDIGRPASPVTVDCDHLGRESSRTCGIQQ